MHEFHGVNYFNGKYQDFWQKGYGDRYLEILNANRDGIKLTTAGHIHHLELRSQIAPNMPELNIP